MRLNRGRFGYDFRFRLFIHLNEILALALTIGIVVGTYSSIVIASPIVMWLGVSREDFIKVDKKPEAEVIPKAPTV